jgi:hypothetical protein
MAGRKSGRKGILLQKKVLRREIPRAKGKIN